MCGGPYYYNGIPAWLIWYKSLFHYVIPISLMTIFSNTLVFRVILQKRYLSLAQGWRRYRIMTIQLFFVSIIFIMLIIFQSFFIHLLFLEHIQNY